MYTLCELTRRFTRQADSTQLVLDYKIRSTLAFRPSDCSLADLAETDPAVNILSLTQIYLDVPCHVTYILDTLQDDLGRYVSEQNRDRSVLGHVDRHHLELDPSIQSHGGQAVLSIPDSVCSDSKMTSSGNEVIL